MKWPLVRRLQVSADTMWILILCCVVRVNGSRRVELGGRQFTYEGIPMKSFVSKLTVVALIGLAGLVGCGRDPAVTPGDIAEGDVPAAQPVTVRGSLERVLDERSFTMSGTAEFFSDDLVVVSRTVLPAMTVGDEIEVTGTVRNVSHIEIERETNWRFNPQITVELADVRGYLVADTVRLIERQ